MNNMKGTIEMKTLEELGIRPAPWTCDTEEPAAYAKDGRCVADCEIYFEYRKDLADARLIAAAPDLYEALRLILETIDALGFNPVVESDPLALAVKCSEKALEKAGGKK